MNMQLNILDPVALLKDMPENKLIKGQVGAIVEAHGNDMYEVEFVEKSAIH